MKGSALAEILDAASRQVRAWPEWMQRPEHRRRQPAGNGGQVGDSMQWAAEKRAEAFEASEAGKAQKKRIDEWNKLATRAEKLEVGKLPLGDLQFLLRSHTRTLYYPHDNVPQDNLDRLKKILKRA